MGVDEVTAASGRDGGRMLVSGTEHGGRGTEAGAQPLPLVSASQA